ncbi:pannexin-1b isoform X1 [Silurus meridionalis]|uniref:pannexin-1b isoform X1 n=1 Tax=Silurus meridionalis TaxID=175797 RepID=UPI001EEBC949|nr:pannexin-1b isoform X1 [Silurus meridionalis]
MAIAHVATEYVFADFLLKEPSEGKYRGVRLDLTADKLVTFIAVGLPLLLISLAFAQEVSVGSQISCFPPTGFSLRQAAFVDSFCWVVTESQTTEDGSPLWLHKVTHCQISNTKYYIYIPECPETLHFLCSQFFPYILLLLAILVYVPALFWRFTAAPQLSSDLSFIMEELDRCYNRAIQHAKNIASSKPEAKDSQEDSHSFLEVTEGCFKYPLVEQYLRTKCWTRSMAWKYLLCRVLTLLTLLLACIYLLYYICLVSLSDQFSCYLQTSVVLNESTLPPVQCKLVAMGVFRLLSCINVVVYLLLIPVVIAAALRPAWPSHQNHLLHPYRLLPAFSSSQGLHEHSRRYDDLSIYLLFLEENLSELKSYKCLQVLELLKDNENEKLDTMCILRTLGQVRTDLVDRRLSSEVDGGDQLAHSKEGAEVPQIKDVSAVLIQDGQQRESSCSCGKDVRQRNV